LKVLPKLTKDHRFVVTELFFTKLLFAKLFFTELLLLNYCLLK